jgi:hypothetical protein
MRTTSSGICTMSSPLRENITTMVNSSAASVIGLILGMNLLSYHSRPLILRKTKRVSMPPKKGMPR